MRSLVLPETVTDGPAPARRYGAAEWRALGTYVHLRVDDADRLEQARVEAVRLLDAVDHGCSRFRDDSDLTRANRAPGTWVAVTPLTCQAVSVALTAASETDGLIDPTLGRSLAAVGYADDFEQVQQRSGPAAIPLPAVPDAWREVQVDPEGAILVPRGVSLDLGATGKAFAADLVAARLSALDIGCLVSVGGDISIGTTDSAAGGPPHTEWPIDIAERPSDPIEQTVTLDRGGLATSSVMHRRWTRGGEGLHHILDPRTGRPAAGAWRTVTVVGHDCVAANTASTLAILLGEAVSAYLLEHDLAARLVRHDGTVVVVAGWPGVTT